MGKFQDFKNSTIKKRRKHMEWLKGRMKELSSLHGGALIAIGLVVLFAGPFAKMAAWAAIAYGAWAIWKKD
tara:strand:+ start:230 stop:442 length:213 start_codon:yes stop_codon:yes gene_type:complete